MVRPPSSADESSVASSTNVLRAGDPRGRTYSSGLKLRKDDPQRMEAWKSAAETLRKAATVGVSGAQVDAFGKPVGFSKSVHRALRPKKVYNRAPNDDARFKELTTVAWTPYESRVNDRRHRWHRTQSDVELGGDTGSGYAADNQFESHYAKHFDESAEATLQVLAKEGKAMPHDSKAQQLEQLASRFALDDGSGPDAARLGPVGRYEDPKVVYPRTKLPQTTDSRVKFGSKDRADKRYHTSYDNVFGAAHDDSRRATNRFSWNRTESTVDLETEDGMVWNTVRTHTKATFPEPENTDALVFPTKELGRKKWNKSHAEMSQFAPTRAQPKAEAPQGPEAWQWAKRPAKHRLAPPKSEDELFGGPAGTFAFVPRAGEGPDRSRKYETAVAEAYVPHEVKAVQALEHKRTRSTWVPGDSRGKNYDTTMQDMFVEYGPDSAGDRSNNRFQWARTSSRVNLTFAEKQKMHGPKRMEWVKQELKNVASEFMVSKVDIKPKTKVENLKSNVTLHHNVPPGGKTGFHYDTSHSKDVFRSPRVEGTPVLGMRANGGLRQKSQVPMHQKSADRAGNYQTSSAHALPKHAEMTRRQMIINQTTIGGHLNWEAQK